MWASGGFGVFYFTAHQESLKQQSRRERHFPAAEGSCTSPFAFQSPRSPLWHSLGARAEGGAPSQQANVSLLEQ